MQQGLNTVYIRQEVSSLFYVKLTRCSAVSFHYQGSHLLNFHLFLPTSQSHAAPFSLCWTGSYSVNRPKKQQRQIFARSIFPSWPLGNSSSYALDGLEVGEANAMNITLIIKENTESWRVKPKKYESQKTSGQLPGIMQGSHQSWELIIWYILDTVMLLYFNGLYNIAGQKKMCSASTI